MEFKYNIFRIWGYHAQKLLEDTPIAIDANGHEFFFQRVEALLQSSGCRNVLKENFGELKGAIWVCSAGKYRNFFRSEPCFVVDFNESGIYIKLCNSDSIDSVEESTHYTSDLLNEYFGAAFLAAEIQKLCTLQFIPESRAVCIKNCKINVAQE
jgi:hypothetical protein